MNDSSPFPTNTQKTLSSSSARSEKNKPAQGGSEILGWWYRIASPPEPADTASFEEKDMFRRGRTGSQITLILYILALISYPAAFAGYDSFLGVILTVNVIFLALALVLNRLGKVNCAGFLVLLCIFVSPMANIVTTPGGLNASILPVFGLLVFSLICAASFLPHGWVFVVALINCIFTLYVLIFLPSVGELHKMLRDAFLGVVTPIILSQILVSIVAFLWVRGARQALQRADQAEEIAKLEAIEIRRQEEQLAISKQIEEGMQQIIATMSIVVTSNDFSIRVPLNQKNILWRVGKSINNLLSRLQGLKQSHEELKKTYAIAAEIVQLMRDEQPVQLQSWTGTAFDSVIIEYNKLLRNTSRELTKSLSTSERIES